VLVDAGRLRTTILAFAEALVWWGDDGPIWIGGEVGDRQLHLAASRSAGAQTPDQPSALFEARRPGAGGGSKLGLYVAGRVAEAQGGRAWGELANGLLTFHVELPLPGPPVTTP
jgi:hypothetical protein